jgi:hypothetical protein
LGKTTLLAGQKTSLEIDSNEQEFGNKGEAYRIPLNSRANFFEPTNQLPLTDPRGRMVKLIVNVAGIKE